MVWGYLQLTGRIEEPLVAGLKRLVTLAVVLGAALHLWLYNSLIVDTFYRAPAQLAAAIVGAGDPVGLLDTIWARGGAVAGFLWSNGGVFSGDFGYYVAGAVVWVLIGLLCVYVMFLIALSSIALSVLLALVRCSWRCCSLTPRGASSSHGSHNWPTTRSSRSSPCWWPPCCCRWSSPTPRRPRCAGRRS